MSAEWNAYAARVRQNVRDAMNAEGPVDEDEVDRETHYRVLATIMEASRTRGARLRTA